MADWRFVYFYADTEKGKKTVNDCLRDFAENNKDFEVNDGSVRIYASNNTGLFFIDKPGDDGYHEFNDIMEAMSDALKTADGDDKITATVGWGQHRYCDVEISSVGVYETARYEITESNPVYDDDGTIIDYAEYEEARDLPVPITIYNEEGSVYEFEEPDIKEY